MEVAAGPYRQGRAKNWIHLVSNTISFENASDAVKELLKAGVIQRVFSEQQKTSALGLARDILSMCGCVPGVSELLGGLWKRLKGEDNALDQIAESPFGSRPRCSWMPTPSTRPAFANAVFTQAPLRRILAGIPFAGAGSSRTQRTSRKIGKGWSSWSR